MILQKHKSMRDVAAQFIFWERLPSDPSVARITVRWWNIAPHVHFGKKPVLMGEETDCLKLTDKDLLQWERYKVS